MSSIQAQSVMMYSVKLAPGSPPVPSHVNFWAAVGKKFGTLPPNL
jgi:hypothetical protein